MTMNSSDRKVGEIIRIEWDQETGDVRMVVDITDQSFKARVLHNKEYFDIITINGKDVIMVASRKENNEEPS